jgi:phospholipid-binding lipoprotein MlaA
MRPLPLIPTCAAALLALALGLPAAGEERARDPRDPWEGYNRAMFSFNLKIDRAVLRPVARGYRKLMPAPARRGISNLFDNLAEPVHLVNDGLQGKPLRAGSDLLRFVINTTIGIGGLFDPATRFGLKRSDEDFGQTLGKWGAGPGPYLVLPLLPPTTLRDGIGQYGDYQIEPTTYLEPDDHRTAVKVVELLDARQRVLDLDATIDEAYDPYSFVRNAWLERRAYQVRDGAPDPDAPGYEDYEDFEQQPAGEPATATSEPPVEPPSEPPPR